MPGTSFIVRLPSYMGQGVPIYLFVSLFFHFPSIILRGTLVIMTLDYDSGCQVWQELYCFAFEATQTTGLSAILRKIALRPLYAVL